MADEHEQRGAVDVGHGQQVLVAVQRPRRDVVGQLVDGGGGEPVSRAQQPHERGVVGQGAEAVDVRVAEVNRQRVVPVLGLHRAEPLGGVGDRLVPRHLLPLPLGGAHHRGTQAVGIVVDVLERKGLGADVPPRERILLVPAHRDDRVGVVELHLEPAHRLAEGAGDVPDVAVSR